ncbi:helix-turn-helix domain-containing protein [Microbacterium murale]|uniref:Uncharacterized protein n=1 Tax=Microbacterium murale TaxID=1081040 RepID=A0ABQ1RGN0_9MICO|nr:helix-turn-helix domain-containing protein [Microbacterium murale]GGD65953.1 hypothetical protein GCM10007269_06460 [Microbacterium murale]
MRQWLLSLSPAHPATSAASPRLRALAESRVGTGAADWAAELTLAVIARLSDQMHDVSSPTEIAGARGCEECLLTTLIGLADSSAGSIVTPEAALDDARVAARAAIPLDRLLRIVWACHAAVEQQLLDVIGERAEPSELLDEVRELVRLLAQFIDRYVHDISSMYATERLESESRLLVERRRIVDAVLGGQDPAAGTEATVGLRWDGYHLAAAGWATSRNRALGSEDSAYRFAERVARQLGGSWLVVERGDHVEFHWAFPHAGAFDSAVFDAGKPTRMRIALGTVERGVAGFVGTTRAARAARAIGLTMNRPSDVVRYDDVGLLALLCADRDQARTFTRRELAGLLGADPKTEAVRETLRYFLLEGRSRQVAAAAMHVAATTVAYRVKRAEELLGRSTTTRTQQTVAALELAHAFPDLVATPR